LGLNGGQKLKEHFRQYVHHQAALPIPEELQILFDHGAENEVKYLLLYIQMKFTGQCWFVWVVILFMTVWQ